MKKNLGMADRIIRTLMAVAVAVLYFTGLINGSTAIILLCVALIFLVTSFLSFCPLYFPFGISTRKKP
jgi:hypothetical protein